MMSYKALITSVFLMVVNLNSYANTNDDPCGGPTLLLNLMNRPTTADSACVVPLGKKEVESGYLYIDASSSAGHIQNFPNPSFRYGFIPNSEVVILLPDYISQSFYPYHGFTATTIGVKHKVAFTSKWLLSAEALFNPPSGGKNFGNNGLESAFNGIFTYNISSTFSASLMVGITSQTDPVVLGGQRFMSINPDLVLTSAITQKLNIFGEIYGQTKASANTGGGYNGDFGILYLILPNISLDLEYGHHIQGDLGGYQQYVGGGISVLL